MTKQLDIITPVILAGGSGTRLWPLSRSQMPKQFCKLDGEYSLFQKTALRTANKELYSKPIILANKQHKSIIQTQLLEIGIEPEAIILEPCGRDTCAAIALAVAINDNSSQGSILVMPSDHLIKDQNAFHIAVLKGHQIAQKQNSLVTMGIKPTRPETGYGYLVAGDAFNSIDGYQLTTFLEKPDAQKAQTLIERDDVFWNAGIFIFSQKTILKELNNHQPEIMSLVQRSLDEGEKSNEMIYPDGEIFGQINPISFDYAVMELTSNAAVVPVAPQWSDLGSWAAMWEIGEKDELGNSLSQNVYQANTQNSLVYSDGPVVGVSDLNDIVVVANRDAVLVTSRENTQGVKSLVEQMGMSEEPVVQKHPGETRPWGSFDSLDVGNMHQVKRIKVVPGGRLSLQYHHHRAEHWVVVSGVATVTVDDDVMQLGPCQQVFIPQGAVHRLENMTDEDVEIIEVQYGSYLGEDDIVRVEDVYGRDPVENADVKQKAA